ncbi:MAG TPA: IS982 family transposase, partial [Trebonia sp.]
EGLYTRVTQRLLAMAACIWHNWATDADDKRSLIAYDH